MRRPLAALALGCAILFFTPANAAEPRVRVAQMARDVTDAVRKQRSRQGARIPAPCGHAAQESKR
jgi:hypothetical protein